mmetsp:Transcript_25022/g.58555  ORF Transcript_25022/g.58555 Transcript_25022/m.58555 type:complete len:85 (+) Transcript_25022:343-597(+)
MTTSTDELKELRLASTLPQRQDSTERCLLPCRRSSWKNDGQKQHPWTLENENDGKNSGCKRAKGWFKRKIYAHTREALATCGNS